MDRMTKTLPRTATITKDELIEKFEDGTRLQVVNVLEPQHYDLGSIKGSKRIPLSRLGERLNELDINKETVTYCAGYECTASRQACEQLASWGFKVKAYEGGIQEWKQAGLPMERS